MRVYIFLGGRFIGSNSAIFFSAEKRGEMGACASKPKGCVGIRGRKLVRRKKHKVSRRRNVSKTHSASQNLSKIEPSSSADHSYSNPAFQGTLYITKSVRNHDFSSFEN